MNEMEAKLLWTETLITLVDDGVGLQTDHAVLEVVPGARDHGIQLVGLRLEDPLD
jgi:hypothetical protein